MSKNQIITNAREALKVLNPANYSDPDDVGGYVNDSLDMITEAIRDLLSLVEGEKHPQVYDYMGENERLLKLLSNIAWLSMPSDSEHLYYVPKEDIDKAKEYCGVKI